MEHEVATTFLRDTVARTARDMAEAGEPIILHRDHHAVDKPTLPAIRFVATRPAVQLRSRNEHEYKFMQLP